MNLYVTDNTDIEMGLGDIRIPVMFYVSINCHPYIASMKFETLYLAIDSRIPVGITSVVRKFLKVIPIMEDYELTSNKVAILAEIYPERAAILRNLFMRDKNGLVNYIKELVGDANG